MIDDLPVACISPVLRCTPWYFLVLHPYFTGASWVLLSTFEVNEILLFPPWSSCCDCPGGDRRVGVCSHRATANVGYLGPGFRCFLNGIAHTGDQNSNHEEQDRTQRALPNALFTLNTKTQNTLKKPLKSIAIRTKKKAKAEIHVSR